MNCGLSQDLQQICSPELKTLVLLIKVFWINPLKGGKTLFNSEFLVLFDAYICRRQCVVTHICHGYQIVILLIWTIRIDLISCLGYNANSFLCWVWIFGGNMHTFFPWWPDNELLSLNSLTCFKTCKVLIYARHISSLMMMILLSGYNHRLSADVFFLFQANALV